MLPRSDMPVRYTAMAAPGHSPHIRQMRWETAMAEWTSLDCQGLCCALKAIEVWWQKVQESGGVDPVGGFALVRLERVISDGAWTADQYLRVNRDDVPALPVEGEVDDNCRRDRYGGGRVLPHATGDTAMATSTSLKLDDDLKGRVQQLAASRRRSAHWIMREAIAQYVEREEKREAFKQDALRAWSDYQANGLHLTAEEADAWLAKLEAGEDVEPPDCHA